MENDQSLQIIFETHSTSIDNELGVASGHCDVDLSPRGEHEAEMLGARHRNTGVDVAYVSDLRRSWRTGEIAFAGTPVPIVCDSRLRECDYGELTRRRVEEISAVRERFVFAPFPGGESYAQVTRRVAAWLDDLWIQRHTYVLVIGHRATRYALEHLIRGIPLETAVAQPQNWQPGWVYELPGP